MELSLLVLKKVQVHSLQPIATLFIKQHSSEITYLVSDHTRLSFPLGLESTDTAAAVTALTARAR